MKQKISKAEWRVSYAILLLVILFVSISRPISPLLIDKLEHTFNSEQHHAMMHLNGENHVDKEIILINEMDHHQEKASGHSYYQHLINPFVFYMVSLDFKSVTSQSLIYYKNSFRQTTLYCKTPLAPPPKAIV